MNQNVSFEEKVLSHVRRFQTGTQDNDSKSTCKEMRQPTRMNIQRITKDSCAQMHLPFRSPPKIAQRFNAASWAIKQQSLAGGTKKYYATFAAKPNGNDDLRNLLWRHFRNQL